MSMGNSPADRAIGKQYSERLMAKADADRAMLETCGSAGKGCTFPVI